MRDSAAAVHAFVLDLRKTVNEAPNKHGLTGDEVFAGMMTVLCETIAKTPADMRKMLLQIAHENIDTAVLFEARAADFIVAIEPGTRRQ